MFAIEQLEQLTASFRQEVFEFLAPNTQQRDPDEVRPIRTPLHVHKV